MKHLFYAEDNNLNFIIILDTERDDNINTAIVNWDLSEQEVEAIKTAFAKDENDNSFYEQDPDWKSFEEVMGLMNSFYNIK